MSCNQVIGFDGQIIKNLDDVRKSSPARITVNMWTVNFFTAAKDAGSLIFSVDQHFISDQGKKIINAPNCLELRAEIKHIAVGT